MVEEDPKTEENIDDGDVQIANEVLFADVKPGHALRLRSYPNSGWRVDLAAVASAPW